MLLKHRTYAKGLANINGYVAFLFRCSTCQHKHNENKTMHKIQNHPCQTI